MLVTDWSGLDNLQAKLATIANPDPRPLMKEWLDVIIEDNRAGVLAGLDKDGNPLAPVTYRGGAGAATKLRGSNQAGNITALFKGLASNNLTTAQYKQLDGPPLAPRREESRVISNLHTREPYESGGEWFAEAGWEDVVSIKGVPFLSYHFDGTEVLPQRDLRGVRPNGVRLAIDLLRSWVHSLIQSS